MTLNPGKTHELYPEEPTYYPGVRNPMMGTSQVPTSSSHGDTEETSLLGSSSSAPAPSASYLPSWMSAVSSSGSAAVPANSSPRIQAYPTLEPMADGREMTTFSAGQTRAPAAYPVFAPYTPAPAPAPAAAAPSTITRSPLSSPLPAPVTHVPADRPRDTTIIQVESSFIEDLIAENSRLTNEVEDLRKIMQVCGVDYSAIRYSYLRTLLTDAGATVPGDSQSNFISQTGAVTSYDAGPNDRNHGWCSTD
jgi:hypothetical protein